MLLLELSMYPLGKGESVSSYVSRSLDVIDKSGLNYRLNPMGTVLEGEWDEVMGVVKKCFEEMKKDCSRIEISMKGDWRNASSGQMAHKIEAVEKTLGRKLNK